VLTLFKEAKKGRTYGRLDRDTDARLRMGALRSI